MNGWLAPKTGNRNLSTSRILPEDFPESFQYDLLNEAPKANEPN